MKKLSFQFSLIVAMILFSFASCNHSKENQIALHGNEAYKHFSYKKAIKPKKELVQTPDYYTIPIPDSILAKFNYGKILPVDEAYKDGDLVRFIDSMKFAVRNKNFAFFIKHLSDTIFKGYATGVPETPESFMQYWMNDRGEVDEMFWKETERALSLGGRFLQKDEYPFYGHDIFVIPYLDFPWDISDMFLSQAAIAKQVPVYEKMDKTSKIVGYLNYDIVSVNYEESGIEPLFEGTASVSFEKMEWLKITTLDGKLTGFVDGNYLYAPLGLRIYLEKSHNNWKIRGLSIGE